MADSGVQVFEIADQEQAKVAPGPQTRPADLVRVESLAESLDVAIEVCLVQNLIKSRVKRVRRTPGSCGATHIDVCFGRRRRLPITTRDNVVAESIVSIRNSISHYGLPE